MVVFTSDLFQIDFKNRIISFISTYFYFPTNKYFPFKSSFKNMLSKKLVFLISVDLQYFCFKSSRSSMCEGLTRTRLNGTHWLIVQNNLFVLKYKVANDTRNAELDIKFVCTFIKNLFHEPPPPQKN